ncbi:uncharacterized protein LOC142803823 [Rhipicephalus microplus]
MIAFYSCVLLAVANGVSSWPVETKEVYTAAVVAAPAVATTIHHAPAVSEASRAVSYRSGHPGVPHTIAKASSYTPAVTAVHTVHSSVPTAVVHHAPAYAVHATVPAAVAGVVHHGPAVSEASRVVSYQSANPGVPRTVAKASSYTPAVTSVNTVQASVPTAVVHHAPAYAVHVAVPATVAGIVHHDPSYTYGYYPARYSYGQRYDYHPVHGVAH